MEITPGARSTNSLLPEQRPRRRKRRWQTQPHRRQTPLVQTDPLQAVRTLTAPGPSLSAMLKGRPASLPNPADMTRATQRRNRHLRTR